MRIIIDEDIPFIRNRFPYFIEVEFLSGDKISAEKVKNADAMIIRTRTKCDENLLKDSKVKFIATATIGTDHIDLTWCEKNGVTIANAPGCNAPGVAQYVFAALFKTGFDPRTQTLGIIGYGNVGSTVAEWANMMGIRTLISDPPRKEKGFHDIDYLSLEEVLKNSDAVTLHVPLTKKGIYSTYHLIGDKELSLLKDGSILVNSSRGGVVDEKILKRVLKDGKIKAIVDVWENEPDIDSELLNLVSIGTPHIAGYSAQGKMRATRMALEAFTDYTGILTNLNGLECRPIREEKISRELIEQSYNPQLDFKNLLKHKGAFENLRNQYNYRQEPLYFE